jgi:hypothetical protein
MPVTMKNNNTSGKLSDTQSVDFEVPEGVRYASASTTVTKAVNILDVLS